MPMTDNEDTTLASEAFLETLADGLRGRVDEVAGHPVRIDAGEEGTIWVAVREAAGDAEAEGALMQSLEAHLERLREELGAFSVGVSAGRMDADLVFACRIERPESADK